jgi:vacuolar-type H+-ATPase catalytic subunit A/Vma1
VPDFLNLAITNVLHTRRHAPSIVNISSNPQYYEELSQSMNTALPEVDERTATVASPLIGVQQVTQKIKQDLRMGREHQQGRINWITTIAMGLFQMSASP